MKPLRTGRRQKRVAESPAFAAAERRGRLALTLALAAAARRSRLVLSLVFAAGLAMAPGGALILAATSAAQAAPPDPSTASAQAAPSDVAPSSPGTEHDPARRCSAWTPTRLPLFGDLHVHTALSFDANSLGVRNLPADAYRFARGEEVGLQPYDTDGSARRRARLERPLDFAAVTDHAELLGELHLCRTPGAEGYDSLVCRITRRWPLLAYIFVSSRMLSTTEPSRYSFCGEAGALCRNASTGPWQVIRDAAEGAYDRTDACTFTSFAAYEWSGGPGGSMTHRNVIFADERVPSLPVSFLDEPTGEGLWRHLEKECATAGCRFLTIPHNTNLSNGLLFDTETANPEDQQRRRRYEPLMEIVQHKGDSECRANAEDELCSFEKLPFARMQEQPFPWQWRSPAGLSFARDILGEGLRREGETGTNPFRLGMIGATDTHLGTPGLVDERDYPGHGAGGDTSRVEVPVLPDSLVFNPGGLAGVWAEENSRASIFAALERRETWSTSGPRIVVRFFGGFDLPEDLCTSDRFVEEGYARGVPMGGELRRTTATGPGANAAPARGPVFALSALRDAGTADSPGTPLDRLQVVKVWLSGGEVREKVIDVERSDQADDLDLATCAAPRRGSASLCATWRDPDWDPASPALYYARVIEKPSCRWTAHLCLARGVDCDRPATVPEELSFCCGDEVPKTVRERAVTSPIWVSTDPVAKR